MAPSASLVAAYAALTPSWHSEAPGSPPIKSLPSSALPRRSLASPQPPKHISAGFSPELSASGVEDEAVAVQIPSDLGVCVAARLPEARRPDEAFVNATRNKKVQRELRALNAVVVFIDFYTMVSCLRSKIMPFETNDSHQCRVHAVPKYAGTIL